MEENSTNNAPILVSACLLGVRCKYNGDSNTNRRVLEYVKDRPFIPVCPEQLGGLPIPREPAEIRGGFVVNRKGDDVTEQFMRGAEETLRIAGLTGTRCAILKNGSPSCGSTRIYDGTFTGKRIEGAGLATRLLRENGIEVMSEEDLVP
ncbi:MAG: DUF523 domain-containing protein [Spirochaetae bacterium HGW-Spirochaetae-1]|jgi:uncharacterized protein YbbK (DUF523 family)|nr:MAG: DUF523 domain-containing protein [Spirochaetae bacterium HGW-Spirochaetae-1]